MTPHLNIQAPPIPTMADLRKGNHMVRFAWNAGPVSRINLHIFPNTAQDALCAETVSMTRCEARLEWKKLLKTGFTIVRS